MGQWVFSELRGDDVRRSPTETELFKTEQTAEGEYAGNDALVREVLQNSIDARNGAGPVRVRLAIHNADDAPPRRQLAHYFARLQSPLAAREIAYANGRPKVPCRYLVVEDFGVRGLEGDTLLFHDPPPGDKTPQFFYWFWRNIGRSGKTGDDLGRWGLGKTVYRAASRAGCMFGLTVRESDRRKFLMGQAVLQIHEHDGKEYKPEGYWCSGQGEGGLPLPIDDDDELHAFCSQWKLTRTDEPGLSVVCPFIPAELKADRLLQAVAVHFFTRIIRGELEVEVCGPDLGTVLLDTAHLAGACKKVIWAGPARTKRHTAPPIEFAKQCVSETPAVVTDVLGKTRVPSIADDTLPDETLGKLRREFSGGGLVGIRVRLALPRKKDKDIKGAADVYLQRSDTGQKLDAYYVRDGMTITKINAQAGRRGVQSLVLVDSGPLSEFLGDTEGPAHEDWDSSAERPDRIWARGWKGRVRFVRRIVDSLVELLTPPSTEPDFDLLSDFFSIEQVVGPQKRHIPGDKSKLPAKMEPPVAKPKWYRITDRTGGFTVSRNRDAEVPEGAMLRVSVAYDLPKGNPLKNWSKLDFEIGNGNGALVPKGKGLKAKLEQGNIVLLREIEGKFSFSVDGFDQTNDLYVRVDEVTDVEGDSDA